MLKRVVLMASDIKDEIIINGGEPIRIDNMTLEELLDLLARNEIISLSKIWDGE